MPPIPFKTFVLLAASLKPRAWSWLAAGGWLVAGWLVAGWLLAGWLLVAGWLLGSGWLLVAGWWLRGKEVEKGLSHAEGIGGFIFLPPSLFLW